MRLQSFIVQPLVLGSRLQLRATPSMPACRPHNLPTVMCYTHAGALHISRYLQLGGEIHAGATVF